MKNKKVGRFELNRVHQGDCYWLMWRLPGDCIDTIITDPPYGLRFMGKKWDYDVPGVEVFAEMLRVAKPGAILLCFGGSRTFHRMAVNIEDAGWQIRDCVMWIYGSGFPKSLDVSKTIDKAERGVPHGGLDPTSPNHGKYKGGCSKENPKGQGFGAGPGQFMAEKGTKESRKLVKKAQEWQGYGTALKPAFEPIILAMKPLDGTFAENAVKWGVAGLNIDGGRIAGDVGKTGQGTSDSIYGGGKGLRPEELGTQEFTPHDKGRWPANVILDPEAGAMLDEQSGESKSQVRKGTNRGSIWGSGDETWDERGPTDSGGASRFFYCAKAGPSERGEDNTHPTVKPLALMRYLCRLTKTPMGGIVLDPYAGSGTTLVAAIQEGRDCLGFDHDAEYCGSISAPRVEAARAGLTVQEHKAGQMGLFND